jgi:2-keto-4-pentenoate hydratase
VPSIDIPSLAKRMLSDYDQMNAGSVFSEGLRLSINDAFKLQSAVADLREQRGEKVVGYKIGCVAPVNQRMFGVEHPVFGRLWSSEQFVDGATLQKKDFTELAIEGELAVTLKRDIELDDLSLESIESCVESVAPVIELHNVRMLGEPPHGHELISNNAIHTGVVSAAQIEKPGSPVTTDLAVLFDAEIVDSWKELDWPGDVLKHVPWLAKTLAVEGRQLKRGDVILTAAFGPPLRLGEHTHVEVTSSRFGSVGVTFN